MKHHLLLLILLLGYSGLASATNRYVSTTGSDSGTCDDELNPCLTIQYTIDQSSDGDFISLEAGTYSENITIDAKTLVISGATPQTTIIDGGGTGTVFTLSHTASNEDVVIGGVTIQNGLSASNAGGIFVEVNGSWEFDLTLNDVIIKDNTNSNATGEGGGIAYNSAGDLSIERVTFTGNSASRGAGLSIGSNVKSADVINATFYDNDATGGTYADGGAISFFSDVTMNNSTLANNSAGDGGGIWGGSDAVFSMANSILENATGNNCTFTDTSSLFTDGNNISSDASCTGLSAGSDDQISTDPLLKTSLANNGGQVTTIGLQNNSPAIDAGNNSICSSDDARKESRPEDGDGDGTATCDIGAYEVLCGDSITDGYEDCDNGGANSDSIANACRTDCSDPSCGDSVVDTDESCDDGNLVNTDSCLNTCAVSSCGDGFLQAGEECDDGGDNNDSMSDSCRTTCVEASCGDGVVDTGEECDDGNANNSDTCNNSCISTSEDSSEDSTCGDNTLDEDEECDDGNTSNSDGCSSACEYEEYDDLATLTPPKDTNFSALVINEEVELTAPNPIEDSTSDVIDLCDCVWNMNPDEFADLENTDECENLMTVNQLGQANLMVSVDCGELGSGTYNQTLIAPVPSSSSVGGYSLSAPGACQLQEPNQNSFAFGFTMMLASLFASLLWFRKHKSKL